MTNPIFFGEPGAVRDAVPGSVVVIEGPEAHHAVAVKRLAPGEPVDIVDGAGLRLTGTVAAASPARLEVRVETVTEEDEPAETLILVQALAKGGRDEQAVEAATELGVHRVIPWQSERSIVRWRADKAAKGQAKWQGIAAAAAKQSRRSAVPQVEDMVESKSLAHRLAGVDLVLVLHEEADGALAPAVDDARRRAGDRPLSIAVVVGPEGGISAAEVQLLRSGGAVAVRLGAHVMRSSTAGPAALAVLNSLLGRW